MGVVHLSQIHRHIADENISQTHKPKLNIKILDYHSSPLTLMIARCLTASLDDPLETDDFESNAGRFYT